MAEKMGCPVCGSYTSSIAAAVDSGSPCPVCGCPATVIVEVDLLQKQHGESQLANRVGELLVENGKLRIERDKLKKTVDAIRRELENDSNRRTRPR